MQLLKITFFSFQYMKNGDVETKLNFLLYVEFSMRNSTINTINKKNNSVDCDNIPMLKKIENRYKLYKSAFVMLKKANE